MFTPAFVVAALFAITSAQEYCSVAFIESDTCEYKYDGECDAATSFCSEETDCYDCDPCREFQGDCAACTEQPQCGFCTLGSGVGVCLSLGYVEYIPDLCSGDGGSDWLLGSDECAAPSTCQSNVCEYEFDSECDAGLYCDANTDCFDCDPCQLYSTSCSGCENEGCRYGVLETSFLGLFSRNVPVCSSSENADRALAQSSLNIQYVSSCADGNNLPSGPASPPAPTPAEEYTCDYSDDTCRYQFDNVCDAGTVFCRRGSDCFDCDPCMEYRFDGCDGCTAAGCSWCAADALCLSKGSVPSGSFPSSLSCRTSEDLVDSCEDEPEGTFADPLFRSQEWLFDMINVEEAWDLGYTGKGIGIRVNDDGVDHTHPEFEGKFSAASSCSIYRPADLGKKHGHGTAVASLAAGSADNGSCGTGIAHGAMISGCRIINSEDSNDIAEEILDSSVLYTDMEGMHISQNSYGVPTCLTSGRRRNLQAQCPFPDEIVCSDCSRVDWDDPRPNQNCERSIAAYCQNSLDAEDSDGACTDYLDLFTACEYNSMTTTEQNAFKRGATSGRDGKGIVYVFASGNEHHAGADVNFEGVLTSRYTISVGAVGRDGLHASYSTGGAPLFVVAPGGDLDHYTNNLVAKPGGGCFNMGPGTSFSAPIVSGVIALILEANDDLSWRDVQGVLATSSKVVDSDNSSWTTNGAGLKHSTLYGFGVVDAGAAVKAALAWDLYPQEKQVVVSSGTVDLSVPEYPNSGVVSSIDVDEDDFFVESVAVYLDLMHSSRGDLEIVLVSPSGTESVLQPGRRPENSMEERWKMLTVRHWGEAAAGTWELRLVDHKEGNVADCVDREWTVDASGLELSCGLLERSLVCEDGGEGSRFEAVFGGGLTLNSALLENNEKLTPADACCTCGGGSSPEDIENVLEGWSMAIYGHSTIASAVPVPPAPQSSPVAIPVLPAPQSSAVEAPSPVAEPPVAAPVTTALSPDQPVGEIPVGLPELSPIPKPTDLKPILDIVSTKSSAPVTWMILCMIGPMILLIL